MKQYALVIARGMHGRRPVVVAALVSLAACAGCDSFSGSGGGPGATRPRSEPGGESFRLTVPEAAAGPEAVETAPPQQPIVEVSVWHVRVPSDRRGEAEKIWNHLREDVVGAEARALLGANGFRIGLGNERWLEPIRAILAAIDGARDVAVDPLRMPVGFPLGLELDEEPHDQTLFFVNGEGVLSGASWPDSRNVLVITCGLDVGARGVVDCVVAPQVRQRLAGFEYLRTEAGLWQVPRNRQQTFDVASVRQRLGAGEFLVIAPSSASELYGIVGGAFLTGEIAGRRYDSLIFVRPELVHAAR